jgi:hypothetical protein
MIHDVFHVGEELPRIVFIVHHIHEEDMRCGFTIVEYLQPLSEVTPSEVVQGREFSSFFRGEIVRVKINVTKTHSRDH